jgi:hypothetical protein
MHFPQHVMHFLNIMGCIFLQSTVVTGDGGSRHPSRPQRAPPVLPLRRCNQNALSDL